MKNEAKTKSSSRFEDYYVMMLSVIHGVVLATSASGLYEIIKNFSTVGYWGIFRWIIALVFTVATAWKYIIGAEHLEWQLDLFDIVIPSLFGIMLSSSFLIIDDPLGWTLTMYFLTICGIFANLNVLIKNKKMKSQNERIYRKNLRLNLIMEILAAVIIPALWFIFFEMVFPFTTVFFFLASMLMIVSDYLAVWKSLKI
jgi:hypothetical protein